MQVLSSVEVKVPGKIMLAGEYAVMDGYTSLSFAIDRFLTIHVSAVADRIYEVESNLWTTPVRFASIGLDDCNCSLVHEVLYETILWLNLPPVKISISSQLEITAGVGSSSALCLGLLTACYVFVRKKQFHDISETEWLQLAKKAYNIQLRRQGQASGYDILTQLHGGGVQFLLDKQCWPGETVSVLPQGDLFKKRICFFKGDQGAPTKATVKSTTKWLNSSNKKEWLYGLSSEMVRLLSALLSDQISPSMYTRLISIIGEQRRFFYQSPNFPKYIAACLDKLPGVDQDWTYKTTGAGGEDLIMLIGEEPELVAVKESLMALKWRSYRVAISSQGIRTRIIDTSSKGGADD